jgi:hypothetical protein
MTHEQALDTMASERYLLDEMTERERHVFEDHYFSCGECAEDVRIGALMKEGATAAFAQAPRARATSPGVIARPAPFRRWWPQPSVLVPWAAAATLAVVAGYESLVVVPGLRSGSAPQAVTPVTLRPASRGQEPIVTSGANGAPVVLATDVNPATAGELAYDLRGPDGTGVASGRAPAPAAGTPLYLFVPGRQVAAPGRYVLAVRDLGTGREVGEYRFTVAGK